MRRNTRERRVGGSAPDENRREVFPPRYRAALKAPRALRPREEYEKKKKKEREKKGISRPHYDAVLEIMRGEERPGDLRA